MYCLYHGEEYYEKYDLESLNKDKLLTEQDLARGLARYNDKFGKHELAQDFDVLSLNGGMVASNLADKSYRNDWGKTKAAQNLEVLRLCNEEVAFGLAKWSDKNGWNERSVINDPVIRSLRDGAVGEMIGEILEGKEPEKIVEF